MSTEPLLQAALRVRELGEFGLIQRLQARVEERLPSARPRPAFAGREPRPSLQVGIGDDAAVWHPTPGARQVITTDALVQDVHFRLSTTTWRDLGWKALAVNVSDIAGMGATARYALVTLGLPAETPVASILELYEGLLDLAERLDLDLVGGDVVSSPRLFLSLTVVGEAIGELLRRDAGQPGDVLAVTGSLGASAGGLRLLDTGQAANGPAAHLLEAHLRPWPRVAEAAALVEAGLRCGMDLSDGLLGDLTRLCERSGVGAIVETHRVPVDSCLQAEFGPEALGMAIAGGEDYELLCAGPADAVEQARAALGEVGTPLTAIGRLTPRPSDESFVQLLDDSGRPFRLERGSWDHFRV